MYIVQTNTENMDQLTCNGDREAHKNEGKHVHS